MQCLFWVWDLCIKCGLATVSYFAFVWLFGLRQITYPSELCVPMGQAKLMAMDTKSAELPCWQCHHLGLGSPVEVTTMAVCGKNQGWGPREDLAPLQLLSQRPCFQPQPQHQEQNGRREDV